MSIYEEYTRLLAEIASSVEVRAEEEPYSASKDENAKDELESMYSRF